MGGRGAARRSGANTPSGKTLRDYQSMGVTEMGDFFDMLEKMETPDQLNNGLVQTLTYALGMNGKPEVVSDEELDALIAAGAQPLYRAVDEDVYLIDLIDGDLTWQGHGQYGDGIYFAENADDTFEYGDRMIRGALNSKAKIINLEDAGALQSKYYNQAQEIMDKTWHKDDKAFRGANSARNAYQPPIAEYMNNNNLSLAALNAGYNVIRIPKAGWKKEGDYYVVLDRSVLTMSRTRTSNK